MTNQIRRQWLPVVLIAFVLFSGLPRLGSALYVNAGAVSLAKHHGQLGAELGISQAASLFRRSLIGRSLHPRAAFWLGRLAYADGDLHQATQYLSMAARIQPRDPDTQLLLACTCERSGDYSTAAESLTHVEPMLGTQQAFRDNLIVDLLLSGLEAYASGDEMLAEQQFSHVLELSPHDLLAQYYVWLMCQSRDSASSLSSGSARFIVHARLMEPLSTLYADIKAGSVRKMGTEPFAEDDLLWLGHLFDGFWQPRGMDDCPDSRFCKLRHASIRQLPTEVGCGEDNDSNVQLEISTELAHHLGLDSSQVRLGPNLIQNGDLQDSKCWAEGWGYYEWSRKGRKHSVFRDGFFAGSVSSRTLASSDRVLVITGFWRETSGPGFAPYVGFCSNSLSFVADSVHLISFEYSFWLTAGNVAVTLPGAAHLLRDVLGTSQLPNTQGSWRRVYALVRTGQEEISCAQLLFDSSGLGQVAFDNVQVRQIYGLPGEVRPTAWFGDL